MSLKISPIIDLKVPARTFLLLLMSCFFIGVACAKKKPASVSQMTDQEVCSDLMGGMNRPVYRKALLAEVQHRGISCRDKEGEESTRERQDVLIYEKRF